ncbi:MAG: ABC transporter substrate-binding protein [Lachnospiraceae bacterium]|nr:ABC transporter substrate-binding protein [Lachnospiraceae bacterium]
MNLKRRLLSLLSIAILAVFVIAGCGQNTTPSKESSSKESSSKEPSSKEPSSGPALTKVTLNEVAHSIFYAPMYAAIENGYFEQNGIQLELVTGFGADKVMAAVLSGEADIGFMGPETTVYTYNEGSADAIVNFAQLTQRAGNFIVAREQHKDFKLTDLIGTEVLGGRAGGMPSHDVTWEHIRGIYEWTSRKTPDLKGFKYEEKVVSVS